MARRKESDLLIDCIHVPRTSGLKNRTSFIQVDVPKLAEFYGILVGNNVTNILGSPFHEIQATELGLSPYLGSGESTSCTFIAYSYLSTSYDYFGKLENLKDAALMPNSLLYRSEKGVLS